MLAPFFTSVPPVASALLLLLEARRRAFVVATLVHSLSDTGIFCSSDEDDDEEEAEGEDNCIAAVASTKATTLRSFDGLALRAACLTEASLLKLLAFC